jgi:tellurite resistance protein TehA-like permease
MKITKNMIIGWVIWSIGLLIPMHAGLLDTENVLTEEGHIDNVTGLLSFVAFVACMFIGYMFYDSGSSRAQEQH